MSDLAPEFLRRLRFTPARDLVRGRISGRLDLMATIARSGLPTEAQDLIRRVVKRTRLWMLEKVAVADELIAHFTDGLENGSSIQTLLEKFGNERQAAKLIRRAKKRNRPLPWHVMRGLGWIIAAMLAIYGIMAARFILGRPSPKIDYVAAMNRLNVGLADNEKGWLIYRQAILGIGPRANSKEAEDRLTEVFDARPGSEHWPKVGPWLAEHARVLELTREATAKPRLGFIYGRNGSIRDEQLWPAKGTEHWYAPSPTAGAVVSVLLPHLNDLSQLSHALEQDARFARERGEAARVMSDIMAMQNLARQLHADASFVVTDLVAIGILNRALDVTEEAVGDEKLKLSDEDLQKLAHQISRPKLASDLITFEGDRIMVHDLIQRCYTDDGNGDGHLTLEGYRFMKTIGPVIARPGGSRASDFWHETFIATATPAMSESRRDARKHYDGVMNLADANVHRPMRQANWKVYEQQAPETPDVIRQLRQALGVVFGTHLASAQRSAERTLGHRDGLVIGIALELYRREHGQYPTGLDELVPKYLPTTPADRITGEQVKYRIIDGKPCVYSVGMDRKD
ncbi:MAG TPA: hypothetical protein VGP94_07730, partial [Tepidisphaeraceae bacterium]|nr:hypothetical protein [Tepidisphaeraceae bacterium]